MIPVYNRYFFTLGDPPPVRFVCPECWDGNHSGCTGGECTCDCQLEPVYKINTKFLTNLGRGDSLFV